MIILDSTAPESSGSTQLNTLDPRLYCWITACLPLPQLPEPPDLSEIVHLSRLAETLPQANSHPSRNGYSVSAGLGSGDVSKNTDYPPYGRLCAEALIAVELMGHKGALPILHLVSGQKSVEQATQSGVANYPAPCPCGMCRSNLYATVHGALGRKDTLDIIAAHERGDDTFTSSLPGFLPYNFQTSLNDPDQATPYTTQEFVQTSRQNIFSADFRGLFDDDQIFRMGGDKAFTRQMQASLLATLERLNTNSSSCTCLYADEKYQTFSGLKVMLGTDPFHLSAEMVAVILSVARQQKPEAIIFAGLPIGDYFCSPLGNASQFLLDLQQSLDWSLPIVLVWADGDELGLVRTEATRLVPNLEGLKERGYPPLYDQYQETNPSHSWLRFSSANVICSPLITTLREIDRNRELAAQLENTQLRCKAETRRCWVTSMFLMAATVVAADLCWD